MRKCNQIHIWGAPRYKAHFRFLRKLKDFKWPYGPKNTDLMVRKIRYVICKCKAVISSCNNTLLIDIPNRPCGSETLLDTSLVIQSLYNFCEMILRSLKFAIFFLLQLAKNVAPSGCDLFFDVHGTRTCDYKAVHNLVKAIASDSRAAVTFKQDHIFPCKYTCDVLMSFIV